MDLPGWVDSPMGKVASQFKAFGYKQTGMVYNFVLREAMKGNVLPLARMVALGSTIGAATIYAKDQINHTNNISTSDSLPSQAEKGMLATGAYGLPGSEVNNVVTGAKYGNTTGTVASELGGPTLGTIVQTAQNVDKGIKGNWVPLAKEAISKLPLVGKNLSNRAFPKKDTPAQAMTPKSGKEATPAQLDLQSSKKLKELRDNVVAGDNGMEKLPNGKIALTVNGEVKTFDKLKDATNAARMAHALDDGSQGKYLGQKYYYKDENGDTKSMPKYKHEFDVEDSQNQLDMYTTKDNEDYSAWSEVANRQLKTLTTLRDKYNQDSQSDKVDDVQKKIETLNHDIAKYKSYGGAFKKGSKSANNPYQYSRGANAMKLNLGSAPQSSPGRYAVSARYSVQKPKVSSKKRRV